MCIAIQNIVTLAKHTFQRKIAPDGSKQRLIECEEFIQKLKEISEVMKDLDVEDLGLEQSPSLFPEKSLYPESEADSQFSQYRQDPFTQDYDNEHNPDRYGPENDPERSLENDEKAPVTYIR